jgi:DNA polymerase-1
MGQQAIVKRILFDLEGNGLLPTITKVHCAATVDLLSGERKVFGPNDGPNYIHAFLSYLREADVAVAHNGLRYDFPVLEKLYGFTLPIERKLDTLVLARLIKPNIKETDGLYNASALKRGLPTMGPQFGSHSIEAWGLRLGIPKLHADIEDWSEWTQEIQDRCVGDIETNVRLWQYLAPDSYSQPAIMLEHRTAELVEKITVAGWPFNMEKAGALHARLVTEQHEVEKALKGEFGGWWKNKGEFVPKKPHAKLGYWGEYVEENHYTDKQGNPCEPYVKKVFHGYPCTKIEWTEFNPSSRDHIERCLRKLGWQPTEFTETGKAKLDDAVIEGLADAFPQSGGLAKYLMIDKRLGQLADGDQAWLLNVADDGRIHAQYNPMGTVTSRAAHFRPNIGQVPACSSPYGKECRELFYVPPGWQMVGADMSGLELRCLAHYMAKYDDGAYGKVILEGDVHWENVLAMSFIESCPRDKHNALHTLLRETGAKRFLYAWLYGAGDLKAGSIILDACRGARGLGTPEGQAVYDKFFTGVPSERDLKRAGRSVKEAFLSKTTGLAKLVFTVKEVAEVNNALPGIDKRRLPVRYAHAALNTLLQACGAILCKQWICDAYDALIAEGLKWGWDGDFVFLAWVHDELQVACRDGLGDRVGGVLTACARSAGEPFGFRIPLDSEYKVGNDWSTTH